MDNYIEKCECYIRSLRQNDKNVLAEATIIRRLEDNIYLAEYDGVKCHAVYNPFKGRFYVDDVNGKIPEIRRPDSRAR